MVSLKRGLSLSSNKRASCRRLFFLTSGTTLSRGMLSALSIVSSVLKVLLRLSKSRARATPITAAIKPTIPTINVLRGLLASVGTMAGSTMRTFVESMSAVAVVSLSRVTKVSYSARVLSTSRWNSRSWNSLRAMSWICALLLLKD
ncbi:hypothetical protein D3C87_1426980 [compost metagenome]